MRRLLLVSVRLCECVCAVSSWHSDERRRRKQHSALGSLSRVLTAPIMPAPIRRHSSDQLGSFIFAHFH